MKVITSNVNSAFIHGDERSRVCYFRKQRMHLIPLVSNTKIITTKRFALIATSTLVLKYSKTDKIKMSIRNQSSVFKADFWSILRILSFTKLSKNTIKKSFKIWRIIEDSSHAAVHRLHNHQLNLLFIHRFT